MTAPTNTRARSPSIGREIVDRLGRAFAPVAAGVRSLTATRQPAPRRQVDEPSAEDVAAVDKRTRRGDVVVSFAGGEVRVLRHLGRRVVDWDRLMLPAGTLRAGLIADPPAVGIALAETFAELGLSRRHVVAALGAPGASSTLLDLPWVKEREVAEVVADEAARQLAVSPDTHYIFWQHVPSRRRERQTFVVAVPREPVLALLEACEVGGLSLDALDLAPLALARAANQRNVIVVSVEVDSLEVAVIVDDLPLLIRGVDLGAGSTVDAVATEVSRALATYEDSAPGRPIDQAAPVFLGGLVAAERADELAFALRARTGHLVGRPNPPLHLPSGFPLAEQLLNVGLALKEI
jgi:hypothetical protein